MNTICNLKVAQQHVENTDKTSSDNVKTLNYYAQKVIPFGINHTTARKLTRVVGKMIMLDDQPFNIANNLSFKNLCATVRTKIQLA